MLHSAYTYSIDHQYQYQYTISIQDIVHKYLMEIGLYLKYPYFFFWYRPLSLGRVA